MAFNQAMSGMHCWRMITDSSSTCARVSKGRYFPGIACLLRNRGRLLLLGVAEGNWISGLSIRKLSLLPRMDGATVHSVMNGDGNAWKHEHSPIILHRSDGECHPANSSQLTGRR
jgi:hypothetical protein